MLILTATAQATGTDPWVIGAAMVAVIGAILGALGVLIKVVYKISRQFGEFRDDWRGDPGRPGIPARLGVPARLQAVEDATSHNALALAAMSEQMGLIAGAVGQLQPNKGSTLNDAIRRIESDTAAAAGRTLPHQHTH